jgi:hypothetical protein
MTKQNMETRTAVEGSRRGCSWIEGRQREGGRRKEEGGSTSTRESGLEASEAEGRDRIRCGPGEEEREEWQLSIMNYGRNQNRRT